MTCNLCGHDNPEGSNFCAHCGAPLPHAGDPVVEERKVVTVLFCDLVGFTAASESADPEDVRHMLSTYFAMARRNIETYGGIVEKFIGDAVVGVFGVPAGHEDDPERAVRAAHRIVEDAADFQSVDGDALRLRIGINTGEALVRIGVTPGGSEGYVTGDAINTASRLQTIAPEMGVAVGAATYQATESVINFNELTPVTVKGKLAPLRAFQAISPRARVTADLLHSQDTPFVGRHIDLALLKGLFAKSLEEQAFQLITIVGEPGLGKSRLVAELAQHLDSRQELINWRQGRCLPYGEGITFSALSDIVKSHAGIMESDPVENATTKLEAVLPEGSEQQWFKQRLLPLLGIEASSGAQQSELFTAWRRFLEDIAKAAPTVLVFEDLHWADEAMLEFIEYLSDHCQGIPLLVVGTARPEVFDRHPKFATRLRKDATIHLRPLTDQETTHLISAMLGSARLPPNVQRSVVSRSGGNPLYAEEFVRLLRDRGLLAKRHSSLGLVNEADIPLSDSVQALITARLDGLAPDVKSTLMDAAVVGTDFWIGALAAVANRPPHDLDEPLHELSRRELVRSVKASAFEGEVQYRFVHTLVRDVAYSHLPRAARAVRHVAAAQWVESQSHERVEAVADVLAHHYSTALELARVAFDQTDLAHELEAPTLRYLTLAGERALGLNTKAALANLERALTLTPRGHPRRPAALTHWAEALSDAGRYADAVTALEEAIAAMKSSGDLPAAAEAMTQLSTALSRLGDPRWANLSSQEVELLSPLPAGPQLVDALASLAVDESLQGRPRNGLQQADRALNLADELGMPRPARALGYRGVARCLLGDVGGTDDMREAIVMATDAGQGEGVAMLHNNLGMALWTLEGPQSALPVLRAGIAFAVPRGLTGWVATITVSTLDSLTDIGALDEAFEIATALVEDLEESGDVWDLLGVQNVLVRVLALRGQADRVAQNLDWLESSARDQGSPEDILIGLGSAALARSSLGEGDRAAQLLADVAAIPATRETQYYPALLPAMVRTAIKLGRLDVAQEFVRGVEARYPYTQHALVAARAAVAEATGDSDSALAGYTDAGRRWDSFGVVPEQGFALLGAGRCFVASGNASQATHVLNEAREIFVALGAAPALGVTDAHLAEMP